MSREKRYIGDSVYITHDEKHFILTTENGYSYSAANKIFLEPEVMDALIEYVNEVYKRIAANETKNDISDGGDQ